MAERPSARAAERVEAIGQDAATSRALRHALLAELGRYVRFDAHAWLLTDPTTEVGCDPVAEVPCLPELPRLIRLKYATPTNRWTQLATPVATLLDATGGRPERSRLWRELLAAYDVVDVASVVFRDPYGCWGFLDLWRVAPSPPFTAAEAEVLDAVAPVITAALRRSQARTFHPEQPPDVPRGPAVLVLAPDLAVRARTPGTEAFLRSLVPPSGDRPPIPAGAYNVGAQLLARESGVDDHPPQARVHLGHGTWLTLRADRMVASDGEEADVAVTIEPTPPAERLALFGLAHGLSAREAEVLAGSARGLDTRGLAEALHLTEHTVQDHFKSIFAKTGLRTRGALLAAARGT